MWELIKELSPMLSAYKGRLAGGVIGFIAGLLWAFKGFGAAGVFVFCLLFGYYLGKRVDRKDSLKDILNRVLPPKN